MHQRWALSRRTRIALWLAAAGLLAVGASVLTLRSPRERALRHAETVLANVPPGFGLYVDDSLCAECHPQEAASHAETGHARTLRPAAQWPGAAGLDKRTFQDPHRGVKYHYRFDPQDGLAATIPERFGNDPFPLMYAFGSGKRRVTFLSLIPNRFGGTAGIEHRVSVRSGKDGISLELTPGHPSGPPAQQVENFGRVLDPALLERCLECHATRGEIRDQEIQGLEPNVGCQKCHGPGREHATAMREAESRGHQPSPPPRRSALEQIRACSRCHLQSDADNELKAMPDHIRSVRVQAAELLQSRCFTQSEDRLGCSTCHNPHAPIARDAADYVQRCLECHGAPGAVSCPVSPAADCVRCHMPAVEADGEVNRHDHRIRKKPPTAR